MRRMLTSLTAYRTKAVYVTLVLLFTLVSEGGAQMPPSLPAPKQDGSVVIPPGTQVLNAEPAVVNLASPSLIGADYKIAPNDLLEVDVFGVKELNRTVRVNATGTIALPLIGQLQVAGLSPSDAEALIAIKYATRYLQDPQVSIFVKEFTTQRITVDGAVAKPGIFPLTGQITLLRALALAGGAAPLADMEQIMIFRVNSAGEPKSERYDATKIRRGDAPDPILQGEDVIVVNRDIKRAALRDSLFRDIIDTINPFASSYNSLKP